MKKRVYIIPQEVFDVIKIELIGKLNDGNFDSIIDQAGLLRRLREAGKSGEVEWPQ
jgi:hypothetical protein